MPSGTSATSSSRTAASPLTTTRLLSRAFTRAMCSCSSMKPVGSESRSSMRSTRWPPTSMLE
jgi:hypothetical protein